jgi:hypothetical protein
MRLANVIRLTSLVPRQGIKDVARLLTGAPTHFLALQASQIGTSVPGVRPQALQRDALLANALSVLHGRPASAGRASNRAARDYERMGTLRFVRIQDNMNGVRTGEMGAKRP